MIPDIVSGRQGLYCNGRNVAPELVNEILRLQKIPEDDNPIPF